MLIIQVIIVIIRLLLLLSLLLLMLLSNILLVDPVEEEMSRALARLRRALRSPIFSYVNKMLSTPS